MANFIFVFVLFFFSLVTFPYDCLGGRCAIEPDGDGHVTIPNDWTRIEQRAFYYCGLLSITIPDSVTSIGSEAFYMTTSLSTMTIPDSVTSIGYQALLHCGCAVLTYQSTWVLRPASNKPTVLPTGLPTVSPTVLPTVSPTVSTMVSPGCGTIDGGDCVFPFVYLGNTYNGCTVINNYNKMWCATTANFDTDGNWGNCAECTVSTTVSPTTVSSETATDNASSATTVIVVVVVLLLMLICCGVIGLCLLYQCRSTNDQTAFTAANTEERIGLPSPVFNSGYSSAVVGSATATGILAHQMSNKKKSKKKGKKGNQNDLPPAYVDAMNSNAAWGLDP